MTAAPIFSIVTPSFNMLPYLKRCVSSVGDQDESREHIVVDGGSRDGTGDWLRAQSSLASIIEPDKGMYDAVNKGLRRSRGELVSYLNCDEQYLDGTLSTVREYFAANPKVDLVFGDALVIKPDGDLIAYRKAFAPRWPYVVASYLYVMSCTMFLRRRVVESGFLFDTGWRDLGDAEFVVRVLRAGFRAAHIPRYLSAFTITGSNMSGGANARAEERRALDQAPRWIRSFRRPINAVRLAEKVVRGAYRQRFPLEYAVYDSPDSERRTQHTVSRATHRWPSMVAQAASVG